MLKYFDKTFFRFLGVFAAIIALSLLVFVAIGFYEIEVKQNPRFAEPSPSELQPHPPSDAF